MHSLQHKKIILGITGSIAAYKSILLVRQLVKAGAEVQVVLTAAATDFVSPLVLETLSKKKVIQQLSENASWSNHVMLGRWADLMVIAPCSCNTLAKMAAGICDNMLQAVYLSATCPVWVAPAMDEDMWKHPSTKDNLNRLASRGVRVLPVDSGELASGLTGEGRMLEPETILQNITENFHPKSRTLAGKRALVTAGPTYEAIDPVRFVGNHSTGKMGVEIAAALAKAGAHTTLILGPSTQPIPENVQVIRVTTALEMMEEVQKVQQETEIFVMAAAVADYRPEQVAKEKIKKTEDELVIRLVKNPDILAWCGANRLPGQVIMGFALETNSEEEAAQKKLKTKNADFIVLNSMRDPEAGFGKATNKITIFENNGQKQAFPVLSKAEVAFHLVEKIATKIHESK